MRKNKIDDFFFMIILLSGWLFGILNLICGGKENVYQKITGILKIKQEESSPKFMKPNQTIPHQSVSDTFKSIKHGAKCNSTQIGWIASHEPIQNSNCPDKSKWMSEYIFLSRNNPNAVLMWIGCNRGDDLAMHMWYWSRNSSSQLEILKPFSSLFQRQRVCPLNQEFDVNSLDMVLPVRPVQGFCVEAMTVTYNIVKEIYKDLRWIWDVEVIHAAVSSTPGVVNFPIHESGSEAYGIGTQAEATDVVEQITVDSISGKYKLKSIDILSIDTEGNDMRVIFGAIRTLPLVKYLEFEYHTVNRWSQSDLQDLIDLLDQYEFDCFWGGNNGQLLRLTGCWHDSYYSKRYWSNVVCANRNVKYLHQAMLKYSFPKLS